MGALAGGAPGAILGGLIGAIIGGQAEEQKVKPALQREIERARKEGKQVKIFIRA